MWNPGWYGQAGIGLEGAILVYPNNWQAFYLLTNGNLLTSDSSGILALKT
jgi:hypothetical protein